MLGGVYIGAGQQQSPAGFVGQAGPDLLTVDHPIVSIEHCRGGQTRQIRPCPRLGEQLAPDVLGGGQRSQEELLDLVGLGMLTNGRRGHPVAHRIQAKRDRAASPLQDVVGDGL